MPRDAGNAIFTITPHVWALGCCVFYCSATPSPNLEVKHIIIALGAVA